MKKASLLLCASALLSLTACGGGNSGESGGTDYKSFKGEVLVWAAEAAVDLTTAQCAAFLKNNGMSATDVKITVNAQGEGDAAAKMTTDVTSGADIYFFAQDQLASLRAAGALSGIGGKYKTNIENNNGEGAVKAATIGDKVYAFPATSDNGYYLYYDGSKLTENDVKKWEDIISKAQTNKWEVNFEYGSAWYNFGFFYACGCDSVWTTDSKGTFTDFEDNYNSDGGVNALKVMANLFKDKAAVNNNSGAGNIGENAVALVSGTWDYEAMTKKWGDNLKCAELPTFNLNGKDVHTASFSGMKFVGVKPQKDTTKAQFLYALADYLTGEEGQAQRFNTLKWGPSNKVVAASDAVKAAPQLAALAAQNIYAKPQGQFPQKWWDFAGALPKDAIDLGEDATDAALRGLLTTYKASCDALKGTDGKGE